MDFTILRWLGRVSLLGVVVLAMTALPATAVGGIILGEEPVEPPERGEVYSPPSSAGNTTPAGKTSTLRVVTQEPAESVEPAEPSPGDARQTLLEPIPDARPSGPATVEVASFKGVTPGTTTMEELRKAWGPPKEIGNQGATATHLYTVEPFKRVEVSFFKDKVTSIVIRLEKAFPANAVAQQLQLDNIRPVLISNELGDILGQVFPERGVMFAFVRSDEPGKPSMRVSEIVLEPISADPFVLRAETNLDSQYELNLADLDESLKLEPQFARAHWLRARVLTAMGKSAEALSAIARAVTLDGKNPRYRITYAQLLDRAGRHDEATRQADRALNLSDRRLHVKARAQCLLGDLAGSAAKPDYKRALDYHMAAVKTADPLAVNRHPAIRLAAKEVLIDAHLGAAGDIAWGPWTQKEAAVPKWIDRAANFAEELIANDGGTDEHRFRVATRALAICVGARGKLDPSEWAQEAIRVGERLIDSAPGPFQKRQLQWELGMALFNGLQVCQLRKENDLALQYGEKTIAYLEAADGVANGGKAETPGHDYLLGRLYFRLGAIHSLSEKDHEAAVTWFGKAIPLLEKPLPARARAERGRHGETFVSMGVSYWETGEHDKAVQLTKQGLTLMRKAVEDGTLPRSALAVPHNNLAAMQRQLGRTELADKSAAAAKAAGLGATAIRPELDDTKQR